MSCRRLEEIDLLAFLEDGASEAFVAFREHYPMCQECSTGVRAYSELHAGLRGGGDPAHPSPAMLEAYGREALLGDARESLARHLERCALCRDELRALARFSPASSPDADTRGAFRAFLDGLLQLARRPAFAVILVGLLLLPLIYRAVPDFRDPLAADALRENASRSEERVDSIRRERALGSSAERYDEARDLNEPTPSAKPAEAPPPVLAEVVEDAPQQNGVADDIARAPSEAQREFARKPKADKKRSMPAAAPSPVAREMIAQKAEPVLEADRAAETVLADSDSPYAGSGILEGHRWIPTLRLKPGQRASAVESEVRHGVFLDIPLPLQVADGEARVRVVPDPAFRAGLAKDEAALKSRSQEAEANVSTEVERSMAVEAGQRALLIELPGGSLDAGRYRVELEILEKGKIAGRGRFRVEIRAE